MEFKRCYGCMRELTAPGEVCFRCGYDNTAGPKEQPAHALPCGAVLAKRYVVGKILGQGGFGITYIGYDTTLNLCVAIKEYYPKNFSIRNHEVTNNVTVTTGDHDGLYQHEREKFLYEARTLAKFCGDPAIVNVRDFFEENNTAYIVMEYLGGITLKQYVKIKGPIRANVLLALMQPIMQILEKIHKQSVIHRDIGPDNIMLMPNGNLKLLDFGAARELGGDKTLSVILKPGYAPEEQYRSKGKQGPWTDIYALCATMYFCLTGVKPDESVERLVNDRLRRPLELGVNISQARESVLLRGMAVRAADRYQSMKELSEALKNSYPVQPSPLDPHTPPEQHSSPNPKRLIIMICGALTAATFIFGTVKIFGSKDVKSTNIDPTLTPTVALTAESLDIENTNEITITEQPISVITKSGDNSAFSVAANGDDLSYQWQTRTNSDDNWVSATGEGCRTPVLSVDTNSPEVQLGNYYYRCLITDQAGAVASSDAASLIVWDYDEGTKTLTIRGRGRMPDWDWDGSKVPWHRENRDATTIMIQDGIENIGSYAFWDTAANVSQATIYIPRTVESIGTHALVGWIYDFEVNSDNPVYCSIDGALFDKSGSTLIQVPGGYGGRYIVPEGTSTIADWAFEWCAYIQEIELPNGITTIGDHAFSCCHGLNKLILPDGLLAIGNHVFENTMYGLRPVLSIPSSVQFIGENELNTIWEKIEVYYSGTEEDWHKINFAAPEGITGDYILYCLPANHSGANTNRYPWFEYAGRWVSGQRSERTSNYYEEELTIRFISTTAFVFSWEKSGVGSLRDLRAEIDSGTEIAFFDDSVNYAVNNGRGTLTFKDGMVTLHIDSSFQNDKVPDGYEVTFYTKESDRLQSAKWFE